MLINLLDNAKTQLTTKQSEFEHNIYLFLDRD